MLRGKQMQKRGMLLHPEDNVVVVLEATKAGDPVEINPGGEILVSHDDVNFGHKLARFDLEADQAVVKYGNPIGKTLQAISGGCHVHVHNIVGLRVDISKEAGK
jgi:hypothetical protein